MAVTVCFIIIIIMSMVFTGAAQVPIIRFEPAQTVYIQGEALTMRCVAANPSNIRSYSYYKDGLETQKASNNILTKPSLAKTDSGLYFCTYSGTLNDSNESNSITLNVIERPASPSLSLQPQYSVHFIGQQVTLSCLVQNRVGVTGITLYQDGRPLPEADNFGVLRIMEFQERNTGNYSCVYTIQVSGRDIESLSSEYKTLAVTQPLPVPTLRVFPSNPQTENTEVRLICETSSPSTIHGYRFYRDGKELTGTTGQKENVFVIAGYNNLFEGCYFCQTFRVKLAQEIKSSESSLSFLTDKVSESDRRGCEKRENPMYSLFSLQGIKLYGSVLVGKILVLLSLLVFFGIRVMLINLRRGKEEIEIEMQT
ncbi:platelet glycoprotein VI [Xenopus laevis]|uniref:Platelet glycoprotein VI n=2 Tax=Xenopus laevis TaxID=8355 RepID=A0A1L8HPS0_XENLA|nr:platelet glycoprotein VI [Xenopus laevis]OCT98057.1 hypothetical protein XELAEV_18010285mg [Xenopus laevis]